MSLFSHRAPGVRFEIKGSSVRPGSSSLNGRIVARQKVVLLVVFVLQLMVAKLQTVQLKFSTSRSEKSRLTPVPHPHQHLVTIIDLLIAMSVLMLISAFFFFSLMSLDTFLHSSLVALHLLLFTTTFFASSLPAIFAALVIFAKIFASSLSTRALLKTLAVLDKGLCGGDKGDRLVAWKIIWIS